MKYRWHLAPHKLPAIIAHLPCTLNPLKKFMFLGFENSVADKIGLDYATAAWHIVAARHCEFLFACRRPSWAFPP